MEKKIGKKEKERGIRPQGSYVGGDPSNYTCKHKGRCLHVG
jgi:hypothetical protein